MIEEIQSTPSKEINPMQSPSFIESTPPGKEERSHANISPLNQQREVLPFDTDYDDLDKLFKQVSQKSKKLEIMSREERQLLL